MLVYTADRRLAFLETEAGHTAHVLVLETYQREVCDRRTLTPLMAESFRDGRPPSALAPLRARPAGLLTPQPQFA